MTQQESMEIQELLQKKQKFLNKAIEALNKQDFEKALLLMNIEQGFTVTISGIIEKSVPKEEPEPSQAPEEPELTIEESTSEDVNTEDEQETT